MKRCPLCGSADVHSSVRRETLPVFQNVVWSSRDDALQAPSSSLTLGTCARCGFSFNVDFDADDITYDKNYDNFVPSRVFQEYYSSLIKMLISNLDIDGGAVYDVGCGKGEFLEMLCQAVPAISGIGIDPSCTPKKNGNFQLIDSFLKPDHFTNETRLVVVRHVLEHIGEPVAFLEMLRECAPDVPFFIEVPDVDWIVENGAFWDFCYEHCNYFTMDSLKACLNAAGFDVEQQQRSFGDQYQWAICRKSNVSSPRKDAGAAVAKLDAYARREQGYIERLNALSENKQVAVWGMATKGVMLSNILGPSRIVGGIDSNVAKQGKFAAGSGIEIHPPGWAEYLASGTPVLVMNPNYQQEIADKLSSLGAQVELLPV